MGKQTSTKFMLYIFSLVMAALLITSGIEAYKKLSERAKAQRVGTETILRWKKSYMALSGTQERWNKTFIRGESVRDLRTLRSLLDLNAYGLRPDSESFSIKTNTEVTSNSIPLKLTKLCLATSGSNFVLQSGSYEQLLQGIVKLTRRHDLYVDNVSIVGDKQIPEAIIADLCIFLRS